MISLTSPVKTRAHSWPAGVKLAALCLLTGGLFFVHNLSTHVAILTAILALYATPGRQFLISGLSKLSILWPFVVIVCGWHWVIDEYTQGAVIVLRLVSAVALANLVTMTTRITDMIDVVRVLSAPLRRFGLNSRSLEIAIALVIRMTPVLLEKGQAISESWRARSRQKVSWRFIIPFALLALDDADQVADALKARGGLSSMEQV